MILATDIIKAIANGAEKPQELARTYIKMYEFPFAEWLSKTKWVRCPYCKKKQQAVTFSTPVCSSCGGKFYYGNRDWMVVKPKGQVR